VRPPSAPEVVFFDIGGTLLNFNIEPSQLFSRILKDHGLAVEPGALYRTMRAVEADMPAPLGTAAQSEAAYWRAFDLRILERLGVNPTREVLDEVSRRFQSELTLEPFAESLKVLEAVRARGLPLGVISNASHGILGDIKRTGLAPFFKHVVYSQAVGAAKPDPAIFREALARFGVAPPKAWHVGDNPVADVEGARGVGIHPVLVDRGGQHAGLDVPRVADLNGVVDLLGGA